MNNDRNLFKTLAYGQYVETHLQDTIDKDQMQKFVDGAMWSFDLVLKQGLSAKTAEKETMMGFIPHAHTGTMPYRMDGVTP